MRDTIETRRRILSERYPVWEKKTIWGHFKDAAEQNPDREFIVTNQGERCSYRQVREEVSRKAAAFLDAGIQAGEHVAVQMRNGPDMVVAMLALAAVGAVGVLVNTELSEQEFLYILQQSDSIVLISDLNHKLPPNMDKLKMIITAQDSVCDCKIPSVAWDDFQGCGNQSGEKSEALSGGDCISNIIYTSGSSDVPKGVLLTHDMLMRSAYANCLNRGFEMGRRLFVPLPLFHVYAYVEGLLAAILVGGTVLLWRGKFSAADAFPFMVEQRANDLLCVPVQMISMLAELESHPREFPDLHSVYCSASICPNWIWPGIRKRFRVDDVITGYGQTEVYGASVQTCPGDDNATLCSKVGKLLSGGSAGIAVLDGYLLQYQVTDRETGVPCKAGAMGELWCRGDAVTPGYYNCPETNREKFTEDGWFKTGDCGWFDSDGYLVLSGRVDDMYKTNGENVSPKYIENVLGKCPNAKEVAVLGISDQKHGQVGVAFLQLYEDNHKTRGKIEQYCRQKLAKFQIPKYFIYMQENDWPRTATGKIKKNFLRTMAETELTR